MTPTTAPAIEAAALTRRFGATLAVDALHLTVPEGIVYGLLGRNGAGKTTTIRMLATLLRPDGGSATVFGHDIVRDADAVRRRICLTGQFGSLDPDLTCIENLVVLGLLLGLGRRGARARASQLLEQFELADAGRRSVSTLSGGMRRRLDFAASLIRRADLLFLDEPTTGLDPHSRRQTWEIVRSIVADGTTVVLTTQYLDEADRLADRVAVIDRGRVIAEGTTAELKRAVGLGHLQVRLLHVEQRGLAEGLLAGQLGVPVSPGEDPALLSARIAGAGTEDEVGAMAARALARLAAEGVGIGQVSLGEPTLDEAFLALTASGDGR